MRVHHSSASLALKSGLPEDVCVSDAQDLLDRRVQELKISARSALALAAMAGQKLRLLLAASAAR